MAFGANQISHLAENLRMRKTVRDLKAAHVRPAGNMQLGLAAPTASWSGNVNWANQQNLIDASFLVKFTPEDSTRRPICDIGLDATLGHSGNPASSDDYDTFSIFPLPPDGNSPQWQVNFTHNGGIASGSTFYQPVSFTVAIFSQIDGVVQVTRTA